MKLLNFSIGQVQAIQIRGETVRTAHVKSAVPEPWVITPDGAEGDQRAVHPDKIYAYARGHYEFWGRELQVDSTQWPDGYFGENLTFDAMDENEVRLGDVFAIGEEVRLVVAGPRHPCAKLCWRLDQPPTFQKAFQRSQHAGIYFGVLNPGTVRPGDVARCIQRDLQMPTMVEVAQYVTDHATPPLGPLQRVLACEHLSRTLRFFLQAKVELARRATAVAEGRWRGWRSFNIERVVEEAPEIRSYYLRPADGGALCQPRPGQFVSVQMQASSGETITRSWSLSAYKEPIDQYRLTVRQQQGIGSNWLHQAQPGATVKLRAPAGEFVLDSGSVRPVVLVAAGIGITPLFAMLQAHLHRGPKSPPLHLIYGGRTPAHLAFREELDAIAASHPEVHVHYVYSRADVGGRPAGRITSELITQLLTGLHVYFGERRIALPWYESDIYLCGPGDFCLQLKQELVDRGANPLHIFLELFSGATIEPTELEQAEVTFARSGVTATWNAAQELTLLELAEQAGIKVENDCRAGTCLTCRTRVVDGQMTADLNDGSGLLCIGRPKTARLSLDC